MPKTKEQKQKTIKGLKDEKEKQKSMVFVDFSGLKVKEMTQLRRKMREGNCQMKVVKKTLLEIFLKDISQEVAKKVRNLKGEIAVAFGYDDEIMPFKILGDFAKDNENLKILAGLLDKKFLEAEEAVAISQLPSKSELLARMVGSIKAPINNFVNVLNGNIKGLIYVLIKVKT